MEVEGVIKSFGVAKGYGFIESAAIPGDVFFSKSALPEELVRAVESRCFDLASREVIFSAEAKDGKTQAHGVQLVPCEGLPIVGKVKSYSPSSGYGFIDADLIDQDVFFMKSELPPSHQAHCEKGTPVSFCAVMTEGGKIQAQQLRVGNGGHGQDGGQGGDPNFAGMDFAGMNPKQLGLAIMSGKMPMPGKFGMLGGRRPSTGESMSGTVKSFNEKHGWGFITSPGVGTDIYFKSSGGLSEGMQVEFTTTIMQDGKVQARDITPGLQEGSNVVGTVKSYSPKNGFGFLRVPGRPSDIHFQKQSLPSDMQDSDQLEGQTFHFSLRLYNGKMQARDLQYSGAPVGYIPPAMGSAQKRAASPGSLSFVTQAPGPKKQKISPSCSPQTLLSGTQVQGVIKSYGVQKGWGFISCSGVDVYFKGSSLPAGHEHRTDLVGSDVAFDLNRSADGKLQATPGIVLL